MATVPSTPRTNFITLGAPGAGPFNVGFRLFEADAITVFIDGVESAAFTLTADFSLGYDDSATITLNASQIAGTTVQIDGTMVADREEDYANPDPGLTRKLNTELGRLWASVSELWQQARRSVRALEDIDPAAGVSGLDLVALSEAGADAAVSAAAALASQQAVEAIEATLPQWQGAWLTATDYEFGHLARQNGTTYFCLINHTSGTFNTDLSDMKWEVFAQKGDAGAGFGDVVAANNGSEFNAATFRANLGLGIGVAVQAFNQLLAAIAGLASNGIIVRTSGSTSAVRTITGTANQILLTDGDGVAGNPTIAAVVASQAEAEAGADTTKLMTAQRVAQAIDAQVTQGRVLLDTQIASASATLNFTAFDNAIYRRYKFELTRLIPSVDGSFLVLRTSTDGGSSYDAGASDYTWGMDGTSGATSTTDGATTNASIILTHTTVGVGNAANEYGVSGFVNVLDPGAAAYTEVMHVINYWRDNGWQSRIQGGGARLSAADVNAVRFFFSGAAITSGEIRMYGYLE